MTFPIFSRIFLPLALAVLAFVQVSCGNRTGVKAIFQKRTPYEAYVHGLREARLDQSAMGQAWITAGRLALQDSLLLTLPFQETGYFRAEKPAAAAFSFRARRGEMVEVKVTTQTRQDIRLFLDLFETGTSQPRTTTHVAAADTTALNLEYRVEENLVYLVRLQPELLKSGRFTITIKARPSLAFPVKGKGNSAVQSFWGAERDNGTRKHEGVDIFAAKGTPVLATSAGVVTRVSETPIGGKVVWLADANARQHIYFAHLDRQMVVDGQVVKAGDTLGLVGNTGNARSTTPHLHFGIYTNQGAVDPFPFIYRNDQKPAPLRVNQNFLGEWARASRNKAVLRRAPDGKAPVLITLPRYTALQVLAGTDEWFRVQLPDGLVGYLHEDQVEKLEKPLQTQTLAADVEVRQEPAAGGALIGRLKKNGRVAVLGFYQTYQLVQLADGSLGWLLPG